VVHDEARERGTEAVRCVAVLREAAVALALNSASPSGLAVSNHAAGRVVRTLLRQRGRSRLDWLIARHRREELVRRIAVGRLALVALDLDAVLDTNAIATDLTGGVTGDCAGNEAAGVCAFDQGNS
jgi:hypothetical protein